MIGSIEVIFGPMFSGKSSELLRKVKRFEYAKKKCLIVNYAKDNRYTCDAVMCTHDKQTKTAVRANKISEILSIFTSYDVIAIDEAQFFPDITEMAERMANAGKIVIVAALDGTFQRKPFGNILSLLPIAENVTKLSAVCIYCNMDASFTARVTESQEVQLIGGEEIYKPVCRGCYHALHGTTGKVKEEAKS